MNKPTAVLANVPKMKTSVLISMADEGKGLLPNAAFSTTKNIMPETNQIKPKGTIRTIFLLVTGENEKFI
jgi:hypothetical protein